MKEIIAYQTKKGNVKTKQYEAEYEDLQQDIQEFWGKIGIPSKYLHEDMFKMLSNVFVSGAANEKPLSIRSFQRKIVAFRRRYEHCERLFQLWKQAEAAKQAGKIGPSPKDDLPF